MDKRNKGNGIVTTVISAFAVSVLLIFLGSLLSAWLIHREYIEMNSLGYLIMGVLSLSGISCGLVARRMAKGKLLITAAAAVGGVFISLLAAGALFFDGKMQGVWEALLLLVGTMLASLLVGTNRKRLGKNRGYRARTG